MGLEAERGDRRPENIRGRRNVKGRGGRRGVVAVIGGRRRGKGNERGIVGGIDIGIIGGRRCIPTLASL